MSSCVCGGNNLFGVLLGRKRGRHSQVLAESLLWEQPAPSFSRSTRSLHLGFVFVFLLKAVSGVGVTEVLERWCTVLKCQLPRESKDRGGTLLPPCLSPSSGSVRPASTSEAVRCLQLLLPPRLRGAGGRNGRGVGDSQDKERPLSSVCAAREASAERLAAAMGAQLRARSKAGADTAAPGQDRRPALKDAAMVLPGNVEMLRPQARATCETHCCPHRSARLRTSWGAQEGPWTDGRAGDGVPGVSPALPGCVALARRGRCSPAVPTGTEHGAPFAFLLKTF